MRELALMWRDSRMIVLTMVVTSVYTAFLIPFKAFALVPGITEVRIANAIPIAFSLLFGPAAAWGAAFGNLLGDVFGGTLGPGSAFGFVGNFFFGMVGYKLWGNLGPLSCGEEPSMRSGRQVVEFVVVALVASAGIGAIIGWGVDLLGLAPFGVVGPIVAVNDFVVAALLGPPLLYVLYPRVKRDGLLYPTLLPAAYLPSVPPRRQRLAAAGLSVVAVGWALVGVGVSLWADGGEALATAARYGLGPVALGLLFVLSALSGERLSAMLDSER